MSHGDILWQYEKVIFLREKYFLYLSIISKHNFHSLWVKHYDFRFFKYKIGNLEVYFLFCIKFLTQLLDSFERNEQVGCQVTHPNCDPPFGINDMQISKNISGYVPSIIPYFSLGISQTNSIQCRSMHTFLLSLDANDSVLKCNLRFLILSCN